MIGRLLVTLACAVALSACGSKPPARPVLRLYCAASIRPPVAEMAALFEEEHNVRIECDHAGSNILLSRIKLTRQGDLYMPGDAHYVDQARQEGLIASSVDACYFVPVILVAKGNPKQIAGLADLTRPGLRLGLGDAQACAIGKVTDQLLAKNKIATADVAANVVFRSLTVNELGLHIKTGKIDATVVWDAIARMYPDEGQIVEYPADKNLISTVPVAVLRSSRHPKVAEAFQQFVTSDRGQAVFSRHHYTIDTPR